MFLDHPTRCQWLQVLGWLSFDSSEFISRLADKVIKIHLVSLSCADRQIENIVISRIICLIFKRVF